MNEPKSMVWCDDCKIEVPADLISMCLPHIGCAKVELENRARSAVCEATYEEPESGKDLVASKALAVRPPPPSKDPDCPADSFIMAAALQMMMFKTPDPRVRARCMELIKYFKGPRTDSF